MTASEPEASPAVAAKTALDWALDRARRGFPVFPCKPGLKEPSHDGWQDEATTDPAIIAPWFARDPNRNYGIAMGRRLPDGRYTVAVDVDMKVKSGVVLKNGEATLDRLCRETGFIDIHKAPLQYTPSGQREDGQCEGGHLLMTTNLPVAGGADKLGPGLDVKASGGYIMGPGSSFEGKRYLPSDNWNDDPIPMPELWVAKLNAPKVNGQGREPLPGIDPVRAKKRALDYLKEQPGVAEGSRGSTAFKIACRIKNLGCDRGTTLDMLDMFWAGSCHPPMPYEDVKESVNNAFSYSQEPQGSAAGEAQFNAVEPEDDGEEPRGNPLAELNTRFAFVDGHIIHETTDPEGRFRLDHMRLDEFHALHANQPLRIGEKAKPVSKWWMTWQKRRQYDGLVFRPGCDVGPRWFNLWRGFSVEPVTKAAHPALDLFLEHALQNVCNGDRGHFRWLMGWFAHMIQRPADKPLVALVLKGKKGSGKNALVECVGHLLGPHFRVADSDRYLLSNFNSHFENCLCIVFDEAVWSGDKKAEGRLKGLITGTRHVIERKGFEPYTVANLTRVALLSNEDWVVPATHDERRFAVFNVGDGRLQDEDFFVSMKEGMRAGGFAHLLRYLLDYDLSAVNVNKAPKTEGLTEQILASLAGPERWLYECASLGRIGCESWPYTTPFVIEKDKVYDDYKWKTRDRSREYRRVADVRHFWRKLIDWLPALKTNRRPSAKEDQQGRPRVAEFPSLRDARSAIDRKVGNLGEWLEPEDDSPALTKEDVFK